MKPLKYATELFLATSVVALLAISSGCKSIPEQVSTITLSESSPTSLPTATLTPTLLPANASTGTPIPTLPSAEAQSKIMDLLENNAGCQFPCWWGFVPGETAWEDVKKTVAPFALRIYEPEAGHNSVEWAEVKFLVPSDVKETPLHQVYRIQNGMVEAIEANVGNLERYSLYKLLAAYGKPTEVWIRTYEKARENDLPFETVLFYSDRRIIMRFYTQGKLRNSVVEGCPQQRPVAGLFFWSADNNWGFLEATSQTQNIRNYDWWSYLPLEEVAQMDVAEFYSTFSDPENTVCIDTPPDYWPSP